MEFPRNINVTQGVITAFCARAVRVGQQPIAHTAHSAIVEIHLLGISFNGNKQLVS